MDKTWELIKSASFMALLAIAGFGLSIYQGFFYERKGQISIGVSPPAKVLDIHKSVGGLEVSYAGQNLRESQKTLWAITATIRNDGNAEITKGDFDESAPLGIRISEGQIVDTPTLRTSIDYLQKNIKLTTSNNSIALSPVIIESGDSIILSLLILGNENIKPKISATGKIAGVPEVRVINLEEEQEYSLWKSIAYAEKWWIYPLRTIFYMFIGAIGFLAIVGLFAALTIPVEAIQNRKTKKEAQKKISQYKRNEPLTREARMLTSAYIESGERRLHIIHDTLNRLANSTALKIKLSGSLSLEEAKEICLKCHPIPKSYEYILKNDIGIDVCDIESIEQISPWMNELASLAEYLNLKLTSAQKKLHVSIDPDLEERLSPLSIQLLNEEAENLERKINQ